MKYPANMPFIIANQEGVVANHGDAIWTELCDELSAGVWYLPTLIAQTLPYLQTYAPVTRLNYLRVILRAVHLGSVEAGDTPPVDFGAGKRLHRFRL